MTNITLTPSGYIHGIKRSIRDTWQVKRSGKGAMSADEFVEWYWKSYGIPREMVKFEIERV